MRKLLLINVILIVINNCLLVYLNLVNLKAKFLPLIVSFYKIKKTNFRGKITVAIILCHELF